MLDLHLRLTLRSDERHFDLDVHPCQVCPPRRFLSPPRLMSKETVQTTKREDLLSSLVRWLDHFHPQQPRPLQDVSLPDQTPSEPSEPELPAAA